MESNDSIGICCFLLFLVVYILFTLIKNGILEICFLKYHFVNNLKLSANESFFVQKNNYYINDVIISVIIVSKGVG